MKKLYSFLLAGLCLSLGSCTLFPIISIRFYNELSMPVNVSYMHLMGYGLDNSNQWHEMDTVYKKIDAGKKLKIKFDGYHTKTFASDSSYFEFIKFETPTKSVCYKGEDEMNKFYNSAKLSKYKFWRVTRGKFFITDSLFNCAK